jgi:hypothetical protein
MFSLAAPYYGHYDSRVRLSSFASTLSVAFSLLVQLSLLSSYVFIWLFVRIFRFVCFSVRVAFVPFVAVWRARMWDGLARPPLEYFPFHVVGF